MSMMIPIPHSPLIDTTPDPKTGELSGRMTREWYRYFSDLGEALGFNINIIDDVLLLAGPTAEDTLGSFLALFANRILDADSRIASVQAMVEGLEKRLAACEMEASRP